MNRFDNTPTRLHLITHRERLGKKHGTGGWEKISTWIDNYVDTLASIGIDTEVTYLDETLSNVAAAQEDEPKAIKAHIHRLYDRFQSDRQSLLILGGHDIVPLYPLLDKTDDWPLDKFALSDSFYVDFLEDEAQHTPQASIGRFPDGGADQGRLLAGQLRRACELHARGGILRLSHTAGLSTVKWKSATDHLYGRLSKTADRLLYSPPVGLKVSFLQGVKKKIVPRDLPADSILFFNVHGHRSNPEWFGQGTLGLQPKVVDAQLLRRAQLENCLLLCQACHGAAIHGRTTTDSLALCSLKKKAAAFVGCTVTSYSFSTPNGAPSTESGIDALFNRLVDNLVRCGMTLGESLRDAKSYIRLASNYDEKNVFGTIILGDPLLRYARPASE